MIKFFTKSKIFFKRYPTKTKNPLLGKSSTSNVKIKMSEWGEICTHIKRGLIFLIQRALTN